MNGITYRIGSNTNIKQSKPLIKIGGVIINESRPVVEVKAIEVKVIQTPTIDVAKIEIPESKPNLLNILSKIYKSKKTKVAIQVVVIAAAGLLINDIASAHGIINTMASGNTSAIPDSVNIQPIMDFINWLTKLIRILSSSLVGLMATYAGWKYISGDTEEAKKILINQGVGIFWIFFGVAISNFFVWKLSTFVGG